MFFWLNSNVARISLIGHLLNRNPNPVSTNPTNYRKLRQHIDVSRTNLPDFYVSVFFFPPSFVWPWDIHQPQAVRRSLVLPLVPITNRSTKNSKSSLGSQKTRQRDPVIYLQYICSSMRRAPPIWFTYGRVYSLHEISLEHEVSPVGQSARSSRFFFFLRRTWRSCCADLSWLLY